MIITQTIQMDLDRMGIAPCIEAVQGDTGTRAVELTLCSGGAPWPIPTGVTGRIRFQKPDGTGGVYDTMPDGTAAVRFQGSRITTTLAPQMLTAAGIVFVQVEMILAGKSLATFPFRVAVQQDLCGDALDSEDYINLSAFVTEQVRQALDMADLGTLEDRVDVLQTQVSTTRGELWEAVQELNDEVADLKYEPIAVGSVSVSPSTAEMGSEVNDVTVSWVLNKEPVRQTLNDVEKAPEFRSQKLTNQHLTTSKTYTIRATDERGASSSKSASVTFLNGVYYGVIEEGTVLISGAVLGLSMKLQSGKAVTFTANAAANQRLTYALPSRYGTPKFVIGGFEYEWTKTTIDFTNIYGYTEKYDIWQHGQPGGGSLSVSVS